MTIPSKFQEIHRSFPFSRTHFFESMKYMRVNQNTGNCEAVLAVSATGYHRLARICMAPLNKNEWCEYDITKDNTIGGIAIHVVPSVYDDIAVMTDGETNIELHMSEEH